MLRAKRPTLQASGVFESCCKGIRDTKRKERLQANQDGVDTATRDYESAGNAGKIHDIHAGSYPLQAEATTEDFIWLYDARLVKGAATRVSYLLIRDGNRAGRCALCNVSRAASLDHHLPKAKHPILSCVPDNLLPACLACNHKKLSKDVPTLNPYFDDLGQGRWLRAEVIETSPAVFSFRIKAQRSWSPELADRAIKHFELLELNETYAFEAARLSAGIRRRLTDLLDAKGTQAVRAHLTGEAESWTHAEPNSWQAALYEAMSESTWYCGGGFAS